MKEKKPSLEQEAPDCMNCGDTGWVRFVGRDNDEIVERCTCSVVKE